jgi:hypothetical protein
MSAVMKAGQAWGEALPDWVRVLAEHCDRLGHRATGRLVGYSYGAISGVINRTYPGRFDRVELAVRGTLMHAVVMCPVLGEIPTDMCLSHQKAGWAPHNPQRIRLYHACRSGCPHSRIGATKK